MASKIFRPRRGKKTTMVSYGTVLAKGEMFFEVPETGVGTGPCKIKMGDGVTAYADLPYAINMDDAVTDVAAAEVEFNSSTSTNNTTLLTEIASGKTVASLFGAIKTLLSNLNTSVTELNNDKAPKDHSSTATTYGVGTDEKYGHLKISDELEKDMGDGVAASQAALHTLYSVLLKGYMDITLLTESGISLMTEDNNELVMEVKLSWA